MFSFSTLREQICYIIDLLWASRNINLLASFSQIATFFHLTKGTIFSQYNRGLEIKECGNKSILSDAQIKALIDYVYDQYQEKNPVTFDLMLCFIQYQFGIPLMITTLYREFHK